MKLVKILNELLNRGEAWDLSSIRSIYHVTPLENLESIKRTGLVPHALNKRLPHETGVYFVSDVIDAWNIAFQLNKIKKSDYVILKIDKNKLEPNVKFYQDLHALREAGFYSTSTIPKSAISVEEIINKDVLLTKNFIREKNKRFYNKK